jgi:putative DNA primase/helicase
MSGEPVRTRLVGTPASADTEAARAGTDAGSKGIRAAETGESSDSKSATGPACESAPWRPEPGHSPIRPARCGSLTIVEPAGTGIEPARNGSGADLGRPSRSQTARPWWSEIPVPAGYALDDRGVSQTSTDARIAGPVWIKATTCDPTSGDHGIVIAWCDPYGDPHELAVTRDELHAYSSTLAARLSRGGLWILPGTERQVLKYLAEFDVLRLPRMTAVTRVGWIEHEDGQLAYMLPQPAGLVALDSQSPVIFQPERESPSSASIYSRGSLAEWNAKVLPLCKDNPLLLFPVLVALSGPLLRFAELESGGFHYYGRSSHGKTTAAQVAASVWGNGADPAEAPDRACIQKWNSTSNAFEALLSGHNDSLLVLDEIHTCDAKDFGAVIYNMASGKGKQSLDRDRQLRPSRRWRTMYFSTGEVSVVSKIEADGKKAHAGQLLRFLDIPVERGIITHTGSAHPAEHADRLKAACSRYFGTAGPALIRALVAEYDDVGQLVGTIKAKMQHNAALLTPKDAPPEIRRAIKRFALTMTAGEMGIKLGVLDCTMAQVEAAVRTALHAWLADGANISDRLRGVMNVKEFIQRHESRFQKTGEAAGPAPRDRVGYMGYDTPGRCQAYLFTSDGFREACGGLDARETAGELKRLGLLVSNEIHHLAPKRDVGSGRIRLYVVRASILDFDPVATSPDTD